MYLPVLQVMSGFHTMEPMGKIKYSIMFKFARWQYYFDVRQLQFLVEFDRMWHRNFSLSLAPVNPEWFYLSGAGSPR